MKQVGLTRRVVFSSGHRYWKNELSEPENRNFFGKWASPFNHGHNYSLEVTCFGTPTAPHNMVVNIKDIDEYLQSEIVTEFDQKSINDQIPHFQSRMPTIENLLTYIAVKMGRCPLPVETTRIKLEETPRLYGEWTREKDREMLTLTRIYEFCASHRLHCNEMSNEENARLFGKCNNPNGHGHNYTLEVTVSGTPDERTGMLADIGEIDKVVNELIVDRYDHHHLNEDLPEFSGVNPTTEAVALRIFDSLTGRLPAKLQRVRLFETARSSFEVTAESE